jgi:hypothetical protein
MTHAESLTPTQRALLKRFATGAVMFRTLRGRSGEHSYFFNAGDGGIRYATVSRLLALGLIEDFSDPAWRWRGSKYRITRVGRETLGNA